MENSTKPEQTPQDNPQNNTNQEQNSLQNSKQESPLLQENQQQQQHTQAQEQQQQEQNREEQNGEQNQQTENNQQNEQEQVKQENQSQKSLKSIPADEDENQTKKRKSSKKSTSSLPRINTNKKNSRPNLSSQQSNKNIYESPKSDHINHKKADLKLVPINKKKKFNMYSGNLDYKLQKGYQTPDIYHSHHIKNMNTTKNQNTTRNLFRTDLQDDKLPPFITNTSNKYDYQKDLEKAHREKYQREHKHKKEDPQEFQIHMNPTQKIEQDINSKYHIKSVNSLDTKTNERVKKVRNEYFNSSYVDYKNRQKEQGNKKQYNIETDVIYKAKQDAHQQRLDKIKNRSNVYKSIEKSFDSGYGSLIKSRSELNIPKSYSYEKEYQLDRENQQFAKRIESVIFRKNQYAAQEKKHWVKKTANVVKEEEEARINENLGNHLQEIKHNKKYIKKISKDQQFQANYVNKHKKQQEYLNKQKQIQIKKELEAEKIRLREIQERKPYYSNIAYKPVLPVHDYDDMKPADREESERIDDDNLKLLQRMMNYDNVLNKKKTELQKRNIQHSKLKKNLSKYVQIQVLPDGSYVSTQNSKQNTIYSKSRGPNSNQQLSSSQLLDQEQQEQQNDFQEEEVDVIQEQQQEEEDEIQENQVATGKQEKQESVNTSSYDVIQSQTTQAHTNAVGNSQKVNQSQQQQDDQMNKVLSNQGIINSQSVNTSQNQIISSNLSNAKLSDPNFSQKVQEDQENPAVQQQQS